IEGRLRGHEVILDTRESQIGSAGTATLSLVDDPDVAALHAVLAEKGGRYLLHCHAMVELNGEQREPDSQVALKGGDVLRIGGSFVRFEQRETR
ncbi:MAG: FHA domain-containing protein, partial [Pseudonocardiales bacterium]|nr:FHA domain-containing protein [Pseudonocardiales bacterium]